MYCYVENMKMVSVIIPVYNVKGYFEECMKSVLEQTYRYLEIILIDDGSDDGSEKLCDLYAEQDKRVIVVHQNNLGQAVARNKGVDIARGEYITFVDSDDILDEHYIEYLYRAIVETGADMSVCFYKKFSKRVRYKVQRLKKDNYVFFNAQEALEDLCYQKRFNSCPFVKMLKKELIEEIKFPANIGYEDYATIYKFIAKAEKIVLLDNILYFYRQRENSTMHKSFNKRKIDRIPISNEILEFIKKYYPSIEEAAVARMFLSNLQVVMDLPCRKQYKYEWESVTKNIKYARKSVLMNKKAKTKMRIMAACSYMGIMPLKILGEIYNLVINKILKC